ncbi:MAG: DUF4097 family beta strand repeat-containing protein [Anaerolineae bacterium]
MPTRNSLMPKALLGIGLLLVATLALAGCDSVTTEETVSQSLEASEAPRIVVETFNGQIEVSAGADGKVDAVVTKRGSGFSQSEAEADLKNVEVTMTREGDTVRIIARRTDNRLDAGNSGASFDLSVPAGAALELHTSNGEIVVIGVTGVVAADTSNGRVVVEDGAGRLDLHTSNGEIEIDADSAQVTAETSNGQIRFKGSLAEGDHSFRTGNGEIVITLPSGARFRIDATTSNGQVTSDFPVSVTGGGGDDELRGTAGEDPAVSIEARTSNGDIEIRQGE